jgi:F-type H+-transporting ATPase subunit O
MWRLAARAAPRLRGAAARGFADAKAPAAKAAAAVEDVVVPLKLFGLPARYASALYVAASKAAVLPTVEKELNTVVELAGVNATFAAFLADPSLTKADKLKGINTILENGKFSATTKQFFCACPTPPRRAA